MAGCSKITDVSLKLLRQCHLLEKLDIRECRSITDEGCEKFLDPNHHYDDDDDDNEQDPNNHSDQDIDGDDDNDENIDRNMKQIKRNCCSTANHGYYHQWEILKERFFIKRRQL